jgi:hypothetical protein
VNFGDNVRLPGHIHVTDLSGRKVMAVDVQPGYAIQQLPITQLSEGLYMINWLESGVIRGRQKVVVTR